MAAADPGLYAYLMNAAAAASLAHYSYAACMPPTPPTGSAPFTLYGSGLPRCSGLQTTPSAGCGLLPSAAAQHNRLLGMAMSSHPKEPAKSPIYHAVGGRRPTGEGTPSDACLRSSTWEPLDCQFLYGSVIPTLGGLSSPPRIHPALLSARMHQSLVERTSGSPLSQQLFHQAFKSQRTVTPI